MIMMMHDEFSYNIQNVKDNKVAVRVLKFHGKEILMYKAGMHCSIEQSLSFESDTVAGFLSRWPRFHPGQVMWDLWCTKWQWGSFSPTVWVSPANCVAILSTAIHSLETEDVPKQQNK
jgi:hypothetical protein